MNPTTGEIKEFPTQEAARNAGFTLPLQKEPARSCKKCYGRGHVGRNDEGQFVPCSCTQHRSG